jgi:AcrR family transcriptional regulator
MADTLHIPDDRTASILGGVRRAFAEKGFDGASMQDLARAAGMSAGNFYRYFQSKDDIIAAMIERDLAEMKIIFGHVMSAPDPSALLLEAFAARLGNLDCDEGPMWAEVDAAANRKPGIARIVMAMESEISGLLTAVLGRIGGLAPEEAAIRYQGQARFLIMLFKAAAQRLHSQSCAMHPDLAGEVRTLVLTTVQRTLNDVAANRPGN